jgi:hypothetical protein
VTLTKQEIFDRAVQQVKTQGQPSAVMRLSTTRCLYRGPNGLKCAAGALIADEHYTTGLDVGSVSCCAPDVSDALIASGVPGSEIGDLVYELQCAHDNEARQGIRSDRTQETLNKWRDHFDHSVRTIAAQHDLDPSVLNATPWGEVSFG